MFSRAATCIVLLCFFASLLVSATPLPAAAAQDANALDARGCRFGSCKLAEPDVASEHFSMSYGGSLRPTAKPMMTFESVAAATPVPAAVETAAPAPDTEADASPSAAAETPAATVAPAASSAPVVAVAPPQVAAAQTNAGSAVRSPGATLVALCAGAAALLFAF